MRVANSAKKILFSSGAILVAIGLNAVPALAGGSSYNTTITMVDARVDGNFTVIIANATTGAPPCASSSSTQLTGSTGTNAGRAILSLAMSAYLTGKSVGVEGNGTCSEYPGFESILRIRTP